MVVTNAKDICVERNTASSNTRPSALADRFASCLSGELRGFQISMVTHMCTGNHKLHLAYCISFTILGGKDTQNFWWQRLDALFVQIRPTKFKDSTSEIWPFEYIEDWEIVIASRLNWLVKDVSWLSRLYWAKGAGSGEALAGGKCQYAVWSGRLIFKHVQRINSNFVYFYALSVHFDMWLEPQPISQTFCSG